MHAALITAFDRPPVYATASEPEGETAQVLASAIHPRVRSQADGSHYTSTGVLPLVPGVDGVARAADGTLRYFVTESGAMAERIALDPRRSVVLPSDVDPVRIAAAMNPAMSSWIALRRRVEAAPGFRVLVLGATGAAGRLAVRTAQRLGAGRVVAAGRDPHKLAALSELGADRLVRLGTDTTAAELADACRDVDVVLDYLWGPVTADALRAIVPARADDEQQLSWVQIGSMAGLESSIPSAALRATRLQIVGSGQGSVSPRDILAELPSLAAALSDDEPVIGVRAVPLRQVESAWSASSRTDDRLVLVP